MSRKQDTEVRDNKECETCNKTKCPEKCFNSHVGSIIALQKLLDHLHVNAYIAGQEHKSVEIVKRK